MENSPYTVAQLASIRHLILQTGLEPNKPDDKTIQEISEHDPKETRKLIQRYFHSIQNTSISTDQLCEMFNTKTESPRRSPRLSNNDISNQPSPIIVNTCQLPPKLRQKKINQNIIHPPNIRSPNKNIIFQLPILTNPPPAVIKHRADHADPEIGSLAVILHSYIGSAQVCRVLGSRIQNNVKFFLVAFFIKEYSPCYVPSEYLFQLNPKTGMKSENEIDFMNETNSQEITVDWVLEKVISLAQSHVVVHSDVLLPKEQLIKSKVRPAQKQIEGLLFQCVSFAALLIVCYICSNYSIPTDKLKKIISTIYIANPPKYASSKAIMNNVEKLYEQLISY
ncbi:hypothetical protein GPJ56_003490 [Histomonas meleagridis]|uniref:uncharacterized protein n=1 Tax=Histomonas meleagridis TaxID=135588 RepID=UPI00355AA059|nr:hypothetical protein GPJ56_003490 [Histomonas meleagridis]KAH0799182.1 hypothetical protein GO595_007979 [Histomonas meleagridis]